MSALPPLPPLHFYPLAVSVLFPITFIVTYFIAVGLGHTEIDWPYISDTSTHPPESCIFSQFINIGALLVAIIVYIRYKQVHEFYQSMNEPLLSRQLNLLSLYIGWLGALGISIVANFQETSVIRVHLTGAILAFGIGSLYLWLQVHCSFRLCPISHGNVIKYFRVVLATLSSVGFVVMIVCGHIAKDKFHGKDKSKWLPEDGGWSFHVASTISEWIVALSFNIFLVTFVPEFKKVTLDSPRIILRINRVDLLFDDENDEYEATYAESVTSIDGVGPSRPNPNRPVIT